jgi:hypothetical protein
MRRFAAKARAPAVGPQPAPDYKDEPSYDRQAAWPNHQVLLTLDDAEMAEQVVSDVIVAECMLRCGSPWRGCGIPAGDLCLLAMQGARVSAAHGSRASQF